MVWGIIERGTLFAINPIIDEVRTTIAIGAPIAKRRVNIITINNKSNISHTPH